MPSLFESITVNTSRPGSIAPPFSSLRIRWCNLPQAIVKRWQRRPAWLRDPLVWIGATWGLCCLWNWAIASMIALSILLAIAVYLWQINRLHVRWVIPQPSSAVSGYRVWLYQRARRGFVAATQLWQRIWSSANRPLTLSLLSGGSGAVLVSCLGLIYRTTHSLVLTMIVGVQTGAIALIGSWLWWSHQQEVSEHRLGAQGFSEPRLTEKMLTANGAIAHPPDKTVTVHPDFGSRKTPPPFDATVWIDLSSCHSATRLIAIYRATDWLRSAVGLDAEQPCHPSHPNIAKLMTCFRLMLGQETHPALQQALQDALMIVQFKACSPVSLGEHGQKP